MCCDWTPISRGCILYSMSRPLFSCCLILSLCCVGHAPLQAEDMGQKPAPIEDPIGLGERLALIDYLREEKNQELPEDPSLEELRRIYWKLEQAPDSKTQQAKRARLARLRHSLEVTYAIVIPRNKTYQELLDIKKLHEDKARKELQALVQKQKRAFEERQQEQGNTGSDTDSKADPDTVKKAVVLIATRSGTGSGFFINKQGYLITNRHVVGSREETPYVTVYWEAGQKRKPENFSIVSISEQRDLALLKPIQAGRQYDFIKTGSHYQLTSDIVTAGFPLGAAVGRHLGTNDIELTMTKGSITAVRKKKDKPFYLQTDASTSQGCSGGPLLDASGQTVLGVITRAIDPKSQGASGRVMTFAIPADSITEEFKEYLRP